MISQDVKHIQSAVQAWGEPSHVPPAVLEEWKWIRYSRILRPHTADILQRDSGDELWVLPGIRGVLQLRKRDGVKIHGLVVREPGRGDGTRLVRAVHAMEHLLRLPKRERHVSFAGLNQSYSAWLRQLLADASAACIARHAAAHAIGLLY